MTKINATATRHNGWWVAEFAINGKEYGTQAKRLDLLDHMIRDAASLMTGTSQDAFEINIEISGLQNPELIDAYKTASLNAKKAEEQLSTTSRKAIKTLTASGLSMRDIGTIMGISMQRVSQLANS